MAETKKLSRAKAAKDKLKKTPDNTLEPAAEEGIDNSLLQSKVEAVAAKSGKRSTKATREAEERQAKEARKIKGSTGVSEEKKPKHPQKPPRSRLERAGKKFREAAKLIEKNKEYNLAEAVELAVKTSTTKFDSAVELHINLGIDPKQADHNIRASVILPSGTGKEVRVAVLADDENIDKAKKTGADLSNREELLKQLDKEKIEFDILIATPVMMRDLAKYARLLGPRGLMPNPKSGTVTNNITRAVGEAKTGKIEYRTDPSGIVHLSIGKVSFGVEKIQKNAEIVMTSIRSVKPASLKGSYIKAVYITTTMGPSIRINPE